MEIILTYDKEGGIDPLDLLGDITISADGTISEACTYLDSWMHALIEGIVAMDLNSKYSVDLMDEPDELRFEKSDDRLTIRYGTQRLSVTPLEEFRRCLKKSATEMVGLLENHPSFNEVPFLLEVAKYAKTG
ncbi:MAG: hypothetical protein AB7Q37_14880 [Pyrinomonadaceae bacterium]